MMGEPLGEKGLDPNQFEFKGAIYEVGPMERHRYFGNRRPITTIKKADTLISATPAPDGMERCCPMVKLDGRGLPCGAEMMPVADGGWVRADQAQSALAAMRVERDALEKAWKGAMANPWCPDVCPITGRRFFMWIDGEPTYGGPFDSYTIPTRDDEGEFSCRRYDHDEGGWKDWSEGLAIKVVDESALLTLEDRAETADAQLKRLTEDNEALRGVVRKLLRSEYESEEPGLCDCIDNDGQAYQSQYLATAIAESEALIGATLNSREKAE